MVCTGNICRSPMVEAFIRHELEARGIDGISVESSGISGWEESPATAEAIDALQEYGLDLSEHRARRFDPPMANSADLVVALSAEHRDAVAQVAPEAVSRTFTLKELVHLLGAVHLSSPDGNADHALRVSVMAAADRRAEDADRGLLDEDVSDPIGLGIETYRALAWEIQDLSRRMVEGLFPDSGSASAGPDHGRQEGSHGRGEGETG